jgi:hypothetical protein
MLIVFPFEDDSRTPDDAQSRVPLELALRQGKQTQNILCHVAAHSQPKIICNFRHEISPR